MNSVLVLLSTYNGEEFLFEQLNSLFKQEGVFVHVLVRDDGSTDNTVRIIQSWIDSGENISLIKGDNLGFAMSFMSLVGEAAEYADQYDYYAFCDQDDVWLPTKLLSAIKKLQEKGVSDRPNLYWSNYTLVDRDLNPLFSSKKVKQNTGQKTIKEYQPTMTKPTILVRYFMLGCTMVFDRNMLDFLNKHKAENKLTMHDLWLSQTAIFFGNVVYDNNSYLLYRQHGKNAAGVDSSWRGRWNRFKKSFKTYERRHFREINARNLLSAYKDVLNDDDYKLIKSVAHYKDSISSRIKLLFNREIRMGSFMSDFMIKMRIIFGLL